jgi:hypothetical protein
MKHAIIISLVALLPLVMGCGDDITEILEPEDLAPPLGLYSITGDQEVTLAWWCSNFEDDLLGYKIYWREGGTAQDPQSTLPASFAAVDSFEVSAPSRGILSRTIAGLQNGTTYSFLVVAARDEWNEISVTSNIIVDAPRPETGVDATIEARQIDPSDAGYELSDFTVVDTSDLDGNYDTSTGGDIMAERFDPGAGSRLWLDGINGAVIQDIGYMQDWQDADVAPADGYVETGHSIEAILGHVYAIRTADNRYGKIQVTGLNVSGGTIDFKAAFQTQAGNPDYK